MKYTLVIAAISLLSLSSCCFNKKDNCNIREANQVVNFKINRDTLLGGFTLSDAAKLSYVILNPATQKFDDSGLMIYHFQTDDGPIEDGTYWFSDIHLSDTIKKIKNKHLIIFLPGTNYADTVFNIDYTTETETYKCNECFFSYDLSELIKVKDRVAEYRGKKFTESGFPITITKN